MRTAKHTPGPWEIFAREGHPLKVGISSCEMVATIFSGTVKDTKKQQAANARLIAAAPDLLHGARCALADLEGLLSTGLIESEHPAFDTVTELRLAIAKAEL